MSVELSHMIDGPEGAAVLVLSGSLGSTVRMWEPQLRALSERFRVLRIDHRGHGDSAVPQGPYRMADLGADALALLDRMGVEQVAWCGLSLGGMVGMWLAAQAPHRIGRLVLCCTSARFPDRGPWEERIAAVRAGGTASIADSVVARWFTAGYAATHPGDVQAARRWVRETPDEGYIGCCEAIKAWDHVAALHTITAPTLVIAGAHDPSTPERPHARTIAEGIAGASLAVLEAAHLATIERATEATQLIMEHLTG